MIFGKGTTSSRAAADLTWKNGPLGPRKRHQDAGFSPEAELPAIVDSDKEMGRSSL